eukprot:9616821-Alexandrium_andersonii.AAC.1
MASQVLVCRSRSLLGEGPSYLRVRSQPPRKPTQDGSTGLRGAARAGLAEDLGTLAGDPVGPTCRAPVDAALGEN